jgi:small-conductance mechanosensitive channel
MFGIKIISARKYAQLLDDLRKSDEDFALLQKNLSREKADCDSLRQQLNDQMKECRKLQQANEKLRQFKRDTLEALANIDLGSSRLKVCISKCDHCKHEPTDCRKYTFGSHTFCVIPKQQPLIA